MKKSEEKLVEMMDGNYFMGVLICDFYFAGVYPRYIKKYGGCIDKVFLISTERGKKYDFTAGYYSESDLQNAKENGLQKFGDKSHLRFFIRESCRLIQDTKEFQKEFEGLSLDRLSHHQLARLLGKIYNLFVNVVGLVLTTQAQCTDGLREVLEKELIKTHALSEINEVIQRLVEQLRPSTIRKEEIAWQEILQKARKTGINSAVVDRLLRKHLSRFKYIAVGDGNYHLSTFDSYRTRLKDDLRKNLDKQLYSFEQKRKQSFPKGVPPIAKKIAFAIRELSYYRLELRFCFQFLDYCVDLVSRETASRFGFTKEEVKNLSFEELRHLLRTQRLSISKEELKKRNQIYVLLWKDNKWHRYFSNEAVRVRDLYVSQYKDVQEFRGQVAYPGIVRGRVKVFYWGDQNLAREISLMKLGAVLVANQTKPMLMPAIRKAGAVVTNEGGITSHAAIVCREYKIPSIIGTKIATKVLKDGMMVEVDANQGTVRIIKHT